MSHTVATVDALLREPRRLARDPPAPSRVSHPHRLRVGVVGFLSRLTAAPDRVQRAVRISSGPVSHGPAQNCPAACPAAATIRSQECMPTKAPTSLGISDRSARS